MSTTQSKHSPPGSVVSIGKLSPKSGFAFDLQSSEAEIAALTEELDLLGLRKLRFQGEIAADGAKDWVLTAKLGATVVQPCVATLAPVTTRLDEAVTRRFVKDWPSEEDLGEETEMPEDDTLEQLGETIDLFSVLREALALALPDYPRADGAEVDRTEARPEGAAPITSIDADGISALSDLKKKLEKGGE